MISEDIERAFELVESKFDMFFVDEMRIGNYVNSEATEESIQEIPKKTTHLCVVEDIDKLNEL